MNPMATDERAPEQEVWCICDLLGHRRHAGRLIEVERFGNKLGRVEVPRADGTWVTVFFGAASVYEITIVTEAVARHVAASGAAATPVSPWDFPKQLAPAPTQSVPYEESPRYHDDDEDSDLDPDPDDFPRF